jgi:hypothetical protein
MYVEALLFRRWQMEIEDAGAALMFFIGFGLLASLIV